MERLRGLVDEAVDSTALIKAEGMKWFNMSTSPLVVSQILADLYNNEETVDRLAPTGAGKWGIWLHCCYEGI